MYQKVYLGHQLAIPFSLESGYIWPNIDSNSKAKVKAFRET